MSKAAELRLISRSRSADAPITYHHRTGDEEGSGGTVLDYYAQEESAEEFYLNGEDELAKAQFLKGFSGYLRKVFSKNEREFLKRLMSGKEKPHEVGRALGVDWFRYMQSIQRKAYRNVKPLLRLSELTGWSRAEEFTATILRRLSLVEEGAELDGLIPQNVDRAKVREALKKQGAAVALAREAEHKTILNFQWRNWYKKHREKHLEKQRERQRKNREKQREYREKTRERRLAYQREYREKTRERAREYYEMRKKIPAVVARQREYQRKNREKLREYQREYKAKKKAEREAAKGVGV